MKPILSLVSVLGLLEKEGIGPVSDLSEVTDGQIALTYSFRAGDEECFIQFNQPNMAQAGTTERFFSRQFQEHSVPIRKVAKTGVHEGLPYSVSVKVSGTPLAALSSEDFDAALPAVIDVLLRIAEIDTGGTKGFGWLDDQCNGKFDSWSAHLLGSFDENPADFHGLWRKLFTSSFLEKALFERYYAKMTGLLAQVPNVRKLVHGDFGYGNVFIQANEVSAILDWQNARYGDPLFDLAGMMLWREPGVAARIYDTYTARLAQSGRVEEIEARVQCYLHYLALDGLRYAAKTDNRGMYDHVVRILERLN